MVHLTSGALKTMVANKLRSAAAVLLAGGLVAVGMGVLASPQAAAEPPRADRAGEAPWGEAVNGWRMRLTLPASNEYRRTAPLPMLLEVENVSGGALALDSLGFWNPDVDVTEAGKRLIVRPLIDVSPWEGRHDALPASSVIKWTLDFNRLRFARPPLKAGTTVQVRVRQVLPSDAARRADAPQLLSNEVAVNLKDDHPAVMAGAADLPEKWTDGMLLVYREHIPLIGYSALRIDGDGRVWVTGTTLERARANRTPLVRTEVVVDRDRLNRLMRFLWDQKVWELAEVAPDDIAYPDEGEIRLSIGAGHGTLVRTFPSHVIRDQPKLKALKAELDDIRAAALKAARP
jgi:hypothetical protein